MNAVLGGLAAERKIREQKRAGLQIKSIAKDGEIVRAGSSRVKWKLRKSSVSPTSRTSGQKRSVEEAAVKKCVGVKPRDFTKSRWYHRCWMCRSDKEPGKLYTKCPTCDNTWYCDSCLNKHFRSSQWMFCERCESTVDVEAFTKAQVWSIEP